MWNIRRIVKKGDYLYAVVPEHPKATKNGYVLEHRVVMENYLERMLNDKEEIHHINGNRHDNRIENLKVKLRGEHQSFHQREKYPNGKEIVVLVCSWCKLEFTREKHNSHLGVYKNHYCSRRCMGKASIDRLHRLKEKPDPF